MEAGCTRDGGGPSEAAVQAEASNHRTLRRSRADVVSVRTRRTESASGMSQEGERE